MTSVIVTTSAFGADKVKSLGQHYFIPVVAQAGGSGIEIRREFFANPPYPLQELREMLRQYPLITVYSAPVPLWNSDGQLNVLDLPVILEEGVTLGAQYIKVSLGHYNPQQSDIIQLKHLLEEFDLGHRGIQFTVENDQTPWGGTIENLHRFFTSCRAHHVPVGMTFDIGNWHWTRSDRFEAAEKLKDSVVYVHCKHVESLRGELHTVPLPSDPGEDWRALLFMFDKDIPRAIEFPIEGENLTETAAGYIKLIAQV
ncbi:sugar phosphate isomerase/epimerase family protein [Paenibacillus naphthalenovorans]|uniref:sugar phosphate isomerase/epimerase family protein n=1 Tax=Paenibacillus naphthalenovorans TaxID=162209 RepID=UPI00088CD021|nr:TIM barrel protein [Paenibacillus naphthalenovorans]SDI67902.1 2-dehydro-3-deoxygluconokinase [Paenibacillus naphthalenovorans]